MSFCTLTQATCIDFYFNLWYIGYIKWAIISEKLLLEAIEFIFIVFIYTRDTFIPKI